MPTTTNLFEDLPESLSPREKWIKKNKVKTFETSGPARDRLGEWLAEWQAEEGEVRAYDKTEDGALIKLSHDLWRDHGIEPWYYKNQPRTEGRPSR